jgi:signal transduction histidine kinase
VAEVAAQLDSAAAPERLRTGFANVLPFLYAVRWGAWLIAFIIVVFGDLPPENTHHEPLLLVLTFAQILAFTLYISFLRTRVRSAFGRSWGPRDDLITLGLVDVALALAVVYLSGGWRTPYYHYAVFALLVPAFLVGWHRSVLLLAGFTAAYVGILSTAGVGTGGSWLHQDTSSLAGLLITPALVVAVVQVLSQLSKRLDQEREAALRAYRETAALYGVAQATAEIDAPGELANRVVEALKRMERFSAVGIFILRDDARLCLQSGFPRESLPSELALSERERRSLSNAGGVVELTTANGIGELVAVPVLSQGGPWGAVAAGFGDGRAEEADLRFLRAVAEQLSLGMTKISLSRQKEELAAQEERSRIAREIHDGIAQSIYMLSLNLEKAAEAARDDARLGERLGRLVGLAKEALLEVRHYIFDLKPLLSGDAGLSSTIDSQIQEFSAVSGLPVELKVEGVERKVPLAVGSSLYRIAPEALANIYRHADATRIEACLVFDGGSVSLEFRDDGRGFAADETFESTGRGLRNIYQRAQELGGDVRVSSAPAQGTTIRVTLPVEG